MFLCTCCTIMFVPQNKESRREVAASAAWLRTTGCEHPPVRTAAPSAWDCEGGCASSVSPQSCAKTNSVPAWLSAKPSMHVWVHERGEEGFLPFDSTFLLRIWHSFLSSAIHTLYGQAGFASMGMYDCSPECQISSPDFPPPLYLCFFHLAVRPWYCHEICIKIFFLPVIAVYFSSLQVIECFPSFLPPERASLRALLCGALWIEFCTWLLSCGPKAICKWWCQYHFFNWYWLITLAFLIILI